MPVVVTAKGVPGKRRPAQAHDVLLGRADRGQEGQQDNYEGFGCHLAGVKVQSTDHTK